MFSKSICKKDLIYFSFVALTHCEEFRRVVDRKHLPALKEFYFLICFPGHLYEVFQDTIFSTYDVTRSFYNVAYHLDEQLVSNYLYKKLTKTVLLFYTSRLNVLLQCNKKERKKG